MTDVELVKELRRRAAVLERDWSSMAKLLLEAANRIAMMPPKLYQPGPPDEDFPMRSGF